MSLTRRRQLAGALVAGLLFFAAPTIWICLQQGLGTVSYLRCESAGLPWGGVAAAVTTLACAAIAGRCWSLRAQGSDAHRFLMVIGAGSAAIFTMAGLAITAAVILVPTCVR